MPSECYEYWYTNCFNKLSHQCLNLTICSLCVCVCVCVYTSMCSNNYGKRPYCMWVFVWLNNEDILFSLSQELCLLLCIVGPIDSIRSAWIWLDTHATSLATENEIKYIVETWGSLLAVVGYHFVYPRNYNSSECGYCGYLLLRMALIEGNMLVKEARVI